MTLGEFFDLTSTNPAIVIYYCVAIPLIAGVINFISGHEGSISPWKYFYSTLIFLVCIPGVFAVFLNIYQFLFERTPILDTNIYTQILPILLMFITLFIIKSNVEFCDIPGFDKLSSFITIISVITILMWFADKTRILAISFTYLPIQYIVLMFIALYIFFRFALKKIIK